MRILGFSLALLLVCTDTPAFAQESEIDPVTKQASQLEAELARVRNTTREAAEVMLKLIDLYHQNGRVFGLVRVGQSFASLHSEHPRHKEAMFKLLDGLRVAGRNKELIAAGRQLLARYPQDRACAGVEKLLAQLLARAGETAGAAAMNEALWKRVGNTPEGREAGRMAVQQYHSLQNVAGFTQAATLADDMLDKLPAGELASWAGWQASYCWERANKWEEAARSGAKALAKSPPKIPSYLQTLHFRTGENYARLKQRTNAAEHFTRAFAVPGLSPRPDIHLRSVQETYNTGPKPGAFQRLVDDYVRKHPERPDRHQLRTMLAITYLTDKQPAKAEQILVEVLPHDARSHNPIGYYFQAIGTEPAKLAAAEQVFRNAIARSATPNNAHPLRYHLAIDLYRDRLKDLPKARAAARSALFDHPCNEGYANTLLSWLLDTAASDAELQGDVNRYLATRKTVPYWPTYRNALSAWITAASNRKEKEIQDRVRWARTQLTAADRDPVFADWVALEKATQQNNGSKIAAARTVILDSPRVKSLPDDLVAELFYQQQHYYRHYTQAPQSLQSIEWARKWTERLPKSRDAAWYYLACTTDLTGAKDHVAAAKHYMTFDLPEPNPDAYRRVLQCAAVAKDQALGKQALAWVQDKIKKHGYNSVNAAVMGDYLEQVDLKAEALEMWRLGLTSDRNSSDSRQCFDRLMSRTMEEADKVKLIDEQLGHDCYWQLNYAIHKADRYLKAGDLNNFEKLLRENVARARERVFLGWSPETDWQLAMSWVTGTRNNKEMAEADRRRIYTVIREMDIFRPSEAAAVALVELDGGKLSPMQRLLALNDATLLAYGDHSDWDILMNFAQTAMTARDYATASALLSGMLANHPRIDEGRRTAGREMITQAYSRMGAGGAAIDDKSPIAPLLQAAMHLRLGDSRLAFETYLANQQLFDQHRHEVPVDLLVFVCESHIAAGGDDNTNRVEDTCRGWLVKNGEAKEIDDLDKARVQLLLGRNYFKSRRYDLARAEFTTVVNRFPETPQAVDAEFGIGETFLEQKVYDQAEQVFDRLAASRERDVVIRAEFLRGVLAHRRGDGDEARDIFRRVLERVPTAELANQVLYNLSEVYGAEQRYIDQLELLRTVGRLGRNSKRWHSPGDALSIVVQDSDLGVSRGHARIPVRVWTEPGGDEETIYLLSGGAGKGLFRADLETRLGTATRDDRILQLTGQDVIRCDYPDAFKKEFKDVPLPDAEIRIAGDARLDFASQKIVDQEEEGFSTQLQREARGEEIDLRKSLVRPKDQVKPGNLLYLRVIDPDRDTGDEPDTIAVKLTSASGDQVSAVLTETGPHTGVFEGTAATGELPAGALATNTAIDHSPLMAIDKDPKTFWLSAPDGATPKVLTVDMKDLKHVDHVTVTTPDPMKNSPIRATLEGSDDGRLWYKLASNPAEAPVLPLEGEFGRMTLKLFEGHNGSRYSNWEQVVTLSKTGKATATEEVDTLKWTRTPGEEKPVHVTALWQGKLVQHRAGAARLLVRGQTSAIFLDGQLVLPVGQGAQRSADVWLEKGTHDLAIFAAGVPQTQTLEAVIFRANNNIAQLVPVPFAASDFDLSQAEAKPATTRKAGTVTAEEATWDIRFQPVEVRYLRLVIHEYRGEAVAISHMVIEDSQEQKVHLPTEADLLSLASNNVLEIAGGDAIKATYIDEVNSTGSSRLLDATLTATYHNAQTTTIAYDVIRSPGGGVVTVSKRLLRIDPGERIVVEVTDYDRDLTASPDEVKVFVRVNDEEPIELTATETQETSGIFTKEVDTSAKEEEGKLKVKAGDRIYCWYVDEQNTLPGHTVKRETIVYVNEPTDGRLRIIETRAVTPQEERAQPQISYLPPSRDRKMVGAAFRAPLTVEVIDRDAAKDSRSRVVVLLTTTDGAKVEVECVLEDRLLDAPGQARVSALEEGRFTGQVIMQLGGKDSPSLVPLTADMPRSLIGGPKMSDEEGGSVDSTLVTRVLNLTGKDIITATYVDEQRPQQGGLELTAEARMLTSGQLVCTDSDYDKQVTSAHVGERLFLRVVDADLDRSSERDRARVLIKSARGEEEMVELVETLAHSGIFTGSVTLKPAEKPTAGNLKDTAPEVECFFGDDLEIIYVDELSSISDGSTEVKIAVKVVIGTDGKLAAFSKRFGDENLAVETLFHIAESHFELYKSHKALGREAEAREDLEAGRKLLREVMEDYPSPKYAPRVAYLLGQFAQEQAGYLKAEEEQQQRGLLFKEALESYQLIVKVYPDHSLAPDAQFKLAQCYEEMQEFSQALDEYVALAATYPKNPLIANVMLRISEHFYKEENFKVAASVGEKFLERFEGHKWSPRMAFRVGQCYYKDKQYTKAGEAFEGFVKKFSGDALAADAMFWAGESYRSGNNLRKAFACYNKCRWDFQATEAAKYARGRLALPEMLRLFEQEANLEEN